MVVYTQLLAYNKIIIHAKSQNLILIIEKKKEGKKRRATIISVKIIQNMEQYCTQKIIMINIIYTKYKKI